jgi:hypothetical protein
MTPNWKLYYKTADDGRCDFAEIHSRGGGLRLRRGRVFTHGTEVEISSEPSLEAEGYHLSHSWTYDPSRPDYQSLAVELSAAISRSAVVSSANAVAIVTDDSVMSVSLAAHCFPSLAEANNDSLWIVDEWKHWIDDPLLDAAFRWLLAYGYHCQSDELPFEKFRDGVVDVFQKTLSSLPPDKLVRLIYIGGSSSGHEWSVGCMSRELSNRMRAWLG